MSNDLQAQISTQIGQTLAQLKQVRSEITQLKAATVANNDAHGQFQRRAGEAFRTAHEGARNTLGQVRELGKAARLAGGEFGHLGEVMRLATGGGSGLATIGIGALAIGAAFEAWNKNLERSIEYAGRLADEESKIADIVEQTNEARGKAAMEATKNSAEPALIGAFANRSAESRAQAIAMATNQPIDDVRKAMIGSLKIKGGAGAQSNAIAAATLYQQAGAGTLSEGIETIAQLGYGGRHGTPSEIAARARGYHITGRRFGMPGDQAFSVAGLNQAISAENAAGILSSRNDLNKSGNAAVRRAEADARSGRGVYEARREDAFAANPLLKHVVDLARSNREIEQHLKQQAVDEYKELGTSFGGKLMWMFKSAFGDTYYQKYNNALREHAATPTNLGN